MGMDVMGVDPINEQGEYFRASIWSWHPLVVIMRVSCSDFLSDQFFEEISLNAGLGANAKQSKLIANRLVQYLEHHVEGKSLSVEEAHSTAAVIAGLLDKFNNTCPDNSAFVVHPSQPDFHISDEHITEWVNFLQNCGGFTVH